jgi:cytidylate kinase
MTVITISREFGSGGADIAQQVAQALGYHHAGQELIGKVLAQYGIVEFDQEYDTTLSFWERFDARRAQRREVMQEMLHRVVLALAQHGNVVIVGRGSFAALAGFGDVVIVGRGSFAALAGFGDVLNVRIQAPLAQRARRVMAQKGLATVEEATATVQEADKVRTAFIESVYGARWDDARAFDLVIDTGKVAAQLAVAWVVAAARALPARPPVDQPSAAALQVDSVLASVVSAQLKCQADHNA